MKKLLTLLLTALISYSAFAQQATEPKKALGEAYSLFGLYAGFNYFPTIQNSNSNMGIFGKFPVGKQFGIEATLGDYTIPIKSYKNGTQSYSGHGEENYLQIGASFLYFLPVMNRMVQAKLGFDYYDFQGGRIADNPGTTAGSCGTCYQMCSNCMPSLFGMNTGLIIDVPLYKEITITSSFAIRFLLNHDSETLPLDFRVGIGYKI